MLAEHLEVASFICRTWSMIIQNTLTILFFFEGANRGQGAILVEAKKPYSRTR